MHSTQAVSVSLLALGLVISAVSASLGYVYGTRQTAQPPISRETVNLLTTEPAIDTEDEGDSSEDEDDSADGDLAAIQAGAFEPCKLVLIVRTDLKMTSGKIAAQCGHATLACYKALAKKNPKLVQHWERTGQAKIALRGSSEDEILELEAIAKSLNLCARSIQDAGRTQVEAGSRTVLGIGPAPVSLVNQVTGHLKLL